MVSYMADYSNLSLIASIIILSAIALAIGGQILGVFNQNVRNTATTSTATNETVAFTANNTDYSPANLPVVSVSAIMNNSGSPANFTNPIGTNNYTITNDGLTVRLTLGTGLIPGNWNVTYTYLAGNSATAWRIGRNATQGIAQLSNFVPIIATVLIGVVVIGTMGVF